MSVYLFAQRFDWEAQANLVGFGPSTRPVEVEIARAPYEKREVHILPGAVQHVGGEREREEPDEAARGARPRQGEHHRNARDPDGAQPVGKAQHGGAPGAEAPSPPELEAEPHLHFPDLREVEIPGYQEEHRPGGPQRDSLRKRQRDPSKRGRPDISILQETGHLYFELAGWGKSENAACLSYVPA